MKNKIEYGGYAWDLQGETYSAFIDEKFIAFTWKFGNIHQAKVNVIYDLKVQGQSVAKPGFNQEARVCLHHQKTRKSAMKRCLSFIKEFKERGSPTVHDTFDYYTKYFKENHRVKILEQLFFTIGNGYDWLDGGLISDPDTYLELLDIMERDAKLTEFFEMAKELLKEHEPIEKTLEEVQEEMYNGDKIQFYPVSKEYSNICFVPDDVKPDWLNLAYEAAILLRDKSGVPDIDSKYIQKQDDDYKRQEENRKIGLDIVNQLETRFPFLKEKKTNTSKN